MTVTENGTATDDDETNRKAEVDNGLSYRLSPKLKSVSLPAAPEEAESNEICTNSAARSSTDAISIAPIFLPSDQTGGIPTELLGTLHNPSIDDDTPAAEALRANAEVHVNKAAKLARKIHVQTVRNIVKKATQRGMGNKRGKPPRIPPNRNEQNDGEIYVVDEEQDEDSSAESGKDDSEEHTEYKGLKFVVEKENRHLGIFDGVEQVPGDVAAATIETGKKLLALADPHDIISNQRWRRRRKRGVDKQNRKSYVKGKVIDGQHELYALSIAVMLGVRTSIGTTNARMSNEQRRWLTSDDFMATEKYKLKPTGGPRTPSHQLGHSFKFKDYSPVAFAYLRRLFGINEFDFLLSVCGNANFIEFISNAKSGQFFFYSSDGKFMIKTMTNAESKFLRRILPHYFRHCSQNPNTILTKFLGMYRVKLFHLRRNVKFVIMNSVYYTDKYLQSFYDLKGSVTGRAAKPGQDVKKDNDLRETMPDSAIALTPVTRARVRKQLVADCEFMKKMKIMDYSLLIGIHHIPPSGRGIRKDKSAGTTGFRFSDSRKESSKFRELLRTSLRDAAGAGHSSMPTMPFNSDHERSAGLSPRPMSSPANVAGLMNVEDASSLTPPKSPIRRLFGMGISASAPTLTSKDSNEQTVDTTKDSDKHFAQLAMYEYGLDDDDDNSYLEGSTNNPIDKVMISNKAIQSLELKKEQTIEQVYWPFHRLYDIHGYRRIVPRRCHLCSSADNCGCNAQDAALNVLKVGAFVPPISDRKDGGLMMDTTGFEHPIKFKTSNGREHFCEGKIFYIGIIDILQQYNTRKRVEARYHRARGSGWQDASCVHPDVYAERFIRFFDEYSQRCDSQGLQLENGEEGIVFTREEAKLEVQP